MTYPRPKSMSMKNESFDNVLAQRAKRKESYRQNQDQAGTKLGEVQTWDELKGIRDDVQMAFGLTRREDEAIKTVNKMCLRWWQAVMDAIDVQTRRDDLPLADMVTVSLTLIELASTIFTASHQIKMLAKMNEMTEMADGLGEFIGSVNDIAARLKKEGVNLSSSDDIRRGIHSDKEREIEQMIAKLARKFQA